MREGMKLELPLATCSWLPSHGLVLCVWTSHRQGHCTAAGNWKTLSRKGTRYQIDAQSSEANGLLPGSWMNRSFLQPWASAMDGWQSTAPGRNEPLLIFLLCQKSWAAKKSWKRLLLAGWGRRILGFSSAFSAYESPSKKTRPSSQVWPLRAEREKEPRLNPVLPKRRQVQAGRSFVSWESRDELQWLKKVSRKPLRTHSFGCGLFSFSSGLGICHWAIARCQWQWRCVPSQKRLPMGRWGALLGVYNLSPKALSLVGAFIPTFFPTNAIPIDQCI